MPGERSVRFKFLYYPSLQHRWSPKLDNCCNLNVATRLKTASRSITEYFGSFLSLCDRLETLERFSVQADDFGRRLEFESFHC